MGSGLRVQFEGLESRNRKVASFETIRKPTNDASARRFSTACQRWHNTHGSLSLQPDIANSRLVHSGDLKKPQRRRAITGVLPSVLLLARKQHRVLLEIAVVCVECQLIPARYNAPALTMDACDMSRS